MSTETERPPHRHYEDHSTPELSAELDRLHARQEKLRGELGAVVGPDPEGPGVWERLQNQIHRVKELLRPMSPFVGGAVAPWPEGEERLHLYALPATSHHGVELLDELLRQGPILAAHHDRVTAVPTEWLHITVGSVVDATEAEAEALAQALDQALAVRGERGQTVAATAALAPVVTEHGVLLDQADPPGEEGLSPVVRLWRAATGARGAGLDEAAPGRVRSAQSVHLSTAYCRAAGPGRSLADQVGRRAPTVEVKVRELALVWVTQDPVAPAYTWRTVATWPLR